MEAMAHLYIYMCVCVIKNADLPIYLPKIVILHSCDKLPAGILLRLYSGM